MSKTNYITKVVKDEETGELGILIPEELLKELDLHLDELLNWELNENNNSIRITKTKIIDGTK